MKIACIGWGSLIWNPDNLPMASQWFSDGPLLSIEFARQSNNGRITLVITDSDKVVRTFWCLLSSSNITDAKSALAKREGIENAQIDKKIGVWEDSVKRDETISKNIESWAKPIDINAVIWTKLPPKFNNEERVPSKEEVVKYLRSLRGDKRDIAEQYIRMTPTQIRTPYREYIEQELGWIPYTAQHNR